MGDIADHYIDRLIDEILDGVKYIPNPVDYWTTRDGKQIKYEDLEEKHARNILGFIERQNGRPHPLLLKRIAYFDSLKPKMEDLL